MKKKRSIFCICLAMILCLMTACRGASTEGKSADGASAAGDSADNEETAQEMSGEAASADIVSASGQEGQESESGMSVSGQGKSDPGTDKQDEEADKPVLEPEGIIFGDEQFEEYLPLLEGKRVALFTNQTGIVGDKIDEAGAADEAAGTGEVQQAIEEDGAAPDSASIESDATLIPFGKDAEDNEIVYGQHILDALLERGVQVEAVFCPEHGFRGTQDAGAEVGDTVDEETGVPVISLYGSGKRGPDSEDMDRFDVFSRTRWFLWEGGQRILLRFTEVLILRTWTDLSFLLLLRV